MNKKTFSILGVVLTLGLVSCGAFTSVSPTTEPFNTQVTSPSTIPQSNTSQPTAEKFSGGNIQKLGFPIPPGAKNIQKIGEDTNFQVKMKLKDVMNFYRDAFKKQGINEDETLTVTSNTTFGMTFKGSSNGPNGQSIVVQGVDMGNGDFNVNLRYE